jgi:hypothetical protein
VRSLLVLALLGCVAALAFAAVTRDRSAHAQAPQARPQHARPKPKPPPLRPPQFVVVSFDGAGGDRMWRYWLSVGRRAHARFTFFLSGVYLLDWAHSTHYHPPGLAPGTSAIGFAETSGDLTIANTLRGLTAGYEDREEIGTHFNGHFCGPGGVGSWSAADWQAELAQFDALVFTRGHRLPFGRSEIVGDRTPCLEGKLGVLYPVLAKLGFRYDASAVAPLGTWPSRRLGLWSFPLLELPFSGHTFAVISMDYNFFANQVDLAPAAAEQQAYASLWDAFRSSYLGNRAPLSIGQHFETWNGWAYDHALTRFLLRACGLPEVRCTGYEQLADFLDSVPKAMLVRYRSGRFPHAGPAEVRRLNRS